MTGVTVRVTRSIELARPITELGTDRPSRHDLGDDESLRALAASMALEGLRHPVLLMPSGELLKGTRRIAAARMLGWTTIQARPVMTIEDAAESIIGQRDELSKPRHIAEAVDLGLTIELLDRRNRGQRHDRDYDSHAIIGPAAFSSGSTYKRARVVVQAARSQDRPAHVVAVAQSVIPLVDIGDLTVTGAHTRVREAERADPVNGLGADGLPMIAPPLGNARSPKARQLRMDWIRALAAKGATSEQIAERLGIGLQGVRKIVRDMGITIPADTALGKTQRKAADPNRAADVAVSDLDALVWSLDRIDVAALDPVKARVWARHLKEYARAIDRVSRKMLKEHVR